MDQSTATVRLQYWTERVRECHTSGLTVKAWCQQNNVSPKTYYYWQRKVRKQIYALKVGSDQSPAGTTRFVDVTPLSVSQTPGYSGFHPDIILRTAGFTMEISNSASDALLTKVGLMLNNA